MTLDGVHCDPPAAYRVTVLTRSAELAAMYIGVTIGALLAHLAENHVGMTLAALDVLVHASQWIFGLRIVIELGLGTNRPPGCGVVAAFARNR